MRKTQFKFIKNLARTHFQHKREYERLRNIWNDCNIPTPMQNFLTIQWELTAIQIIKLFIAEKKYRLVLASEAEQSTDEVLKFIAYEATYLG